MTLLKLVPQLSNFTFFDELARKLLDKNHKYRSKWEELHIEIYRQTIKRENATDIKHFISDRGTVDAFAFLPETMTTVNTSLENEYERYSAVFQLGSTAYLEGGQYDNDEIRRETPDEAIQIESKLREVWYSHPNYSFLPAQENFAVKYKILLSKILNLCF